MAREALPGWQGRAWGRAEVRCAFLSVHVVNPTRGLVFLQLMLPAAACPQTQAGHPREQPCSLLSPQPGEGAKGLNRSPQALYPGPHLLWFGGRSFFGSPPPAPRAPLPDSHRPVRPPVSRCTAWEPRQAPDKAQPA